MVSCEILGLPKESWPGSETHPPELRYVASCPLVRAADVMVWIELGGCIPQQKQGLSFTVMWLVKRTLMVFVLCSRIRKKRMKPIAPKLGSDEARWRWMKGTLVLPARS